MKKIQLTIPEPCHESWDQMQPEEQGRFCLSCQKTVVDFSAMSDREVLAYFDNYKGNTCGRFNNEQLNRALSVPKNRSIGRWKYFWQILLPAVFAIHRADAQPKLGKVSATACTPKDSTIKMVGEVVLVPEKRNITGKITDDNGKPINGATITLKNTKINVISNMNGSFKFNQLQVPSTLIVTAPGFEVKEVTISSSTEFANVKIVLSHQYQYTKGMIIRRPS